jgi:hypothetical protein
MDRQTRESLEKFLLFWDTARALSSKPELGRLRAEAAIDKPRAAAGLPPLVNPLPMSRDL